VRPPLRTTYTYVELEISPQAYDEIADKLRAADYGHCFGEDGTIDMHGLALVRGEATKKEQTCTSS
jgi:hypothetical protein